MRWLALLVALLLPLHSGSTVVVRREAGGGGDFCSTAPTNIFCQDFEPTAACNAGTPAGDTVNGTPNCQDGTTPIGGSFNLTAADDGGEDSVIYTNDFSTTSDIKVICKLDHISDIGNGNSRWLITVNNASGTIVGYVGFAGSVNEFNAEPGYGSGETTGFSDPISDGALNTVCMGLETDATPRVSLRIGADANCDGGTLVGTSASGVADATTVTQIAFYADLYEGGGTTDDFGAFRIDECYIIEEAFN